MNKVAIITDSTCDLSKEIIESRNIKVLPLYVRFGEDIYRDGIDITTDRLYELVEQKNEIPKTSAVSPGDFIEAFEPLIKDGYDIIYTGIGSSLSGTFQSAHIASLEFPENRIYLVDSKNLSTGIGLLVLKACDLRDQGLSASDIKDRLLEIVPKVRSQFAVKTLDYLHKGGRASGTAKLLGTMLRIKPIIQVRDGKMDVYTKTMGKMSRALDVMLTDYINLGEQIDLDYVMITHSQAGKHVDYMSEIVNQKLKPNKLFVTEAGCVISSHCGPGTIGILYIVK
ncbi:MAG TPA: DegV family protein [Acholeplasma sp.]|nr:DegV family protein [Acholeplasma sp.]